MNGQAHSFDTIKMSRAIAPDSSSKFVQPIVLINDELRIKKDHSKSGSAID